MSTMVTGGTGFIGAALVRLLLERDEEEVVAFHRNPAKTTLDDLADRVTRVHGDLGIYSHVLEAIKTHRPKIIYHLGAMLTIPSDSDPPAAFQSNIRMVNYVLNGIEPLQTVQEWVDMVKSRLPGARLTFEPDEGLTQIYRSMPKYDDRCAREEWGWQPQYDHERMIDEFIADLNQHPGRYP